MGINCPRRVVRVPFGAERLGCRGASTPPIRSLRERIGSAQHDSLGGMIECRSYLWAAVGRKKCGAEIGDPNLRFQPRLPGSVVGVASMRQVGKADKITGVTGLW